MKKLTIQKETLTRLEENSVGRVNGGKPIVDTLDCDTMYPCPQCFSRDIDCYELSIAPTC
jgi:hypothetical protein